ncbi:MAG: DEAD/DEAH box helicase [Chloroflexi bacterium]|nr:DEAD/DEAH box helicase [Chloroflexota bacterium]MBV9898857.1 DEAD/DEAH box helicase [Chloroflexota bacterium]
MSPEELVQAFTTSLPYQLDDFQLDAIKALANHHSVLVAAPTGTGKTVVGQFGMFMARQYNARAIYTTPIKALSNQKYRDFRAIWGDDQVGLLTGDVVVNREAPILVMTTEVLRNMLVTGASVEDVGAIVFDEVHYMGDAERGTAWEEAILLAPKGVPLVCLSATVPNAAEVAEWIRDAHGELSCVFHEQRAVPLEHRYWLPDADPEKHTFKVFTVLNDVGEVVTENARRLRAVGGELAGRVRWGGVSSGGFRGESREVGSDKDPREMPAAWRVLRYLEGEELTPAIYFLFSRRATEEAASSCVALKPVPHAQELIRDAKARLSDLSPEDRNLRQVAMLLGRFLPRGVAVHHAGLLPQVKLLVEEFFQAGKLRAVFATDTLALGINMPARTVVIGEMLKYDGQSRRLLTPNEYRQMTGRAGRRGIDERGVSLLMYSHWVTFAQTMRVLTSDLLPLESAFRPTYSTAMNLWLRPEDEERLADLYARSLRRFQHDRTLKELTERKQALEDAFEADRSGEKQLSREEVRERTHELSRVDYELRRARREATIEARRTVEGLARVLERYDYLRDGQPTPKAPYLRSLFDTNALTLSELLTNQQLEALEPPELAEALSWFAMDREGAVRGLPLTRRLHRLREILDALHGGVLREEERHGLQMSRPLPVDFHGVALAWAEGHELATIAQRARLQEGDLVGALQKTLDLVGQLRGAAMQGPLGTRLVPLLDEADGLLRRGVVSASYQWAIGGLPEATDEEDVDWDVQLLPEEDNGFGSTGSRDRRPRRIPPFVLRKMRGLDTSRDKTVRSGARSAIKPRKRR